MGRRCKCQICKATLDTDQAFKITKKYKSKTVNYYYCSEEEYQRKLKESEDKEHCYEVAARYMDVSLIDPVLRREINEIAKYYSYTVIEKTLKAVKPAIDRFLQKESYSSDFAKIRYILAIVKRNINQIHKQHLKEQQELTELFKKSQNQCEAIDLDIMNSLSDVQQTTPQTTVSDISAWL